MVDYFSKFFKTSFENYNTLKSKVVVVATVKQTIFVARQLMCFEVKK